MANKLIIIHLLMFLLFCNMFAQSQHPNLLLTKHDIEDIKTNLGYAGLFDKSFDEAVRVVDAALVNHPDVPYPKDAGGGYTHERHKSNYDLMYKAGILFSVTGEIKYAEFIRDLLNKYAELYPKLGTHPEGKHQKPGRLFWQTLNETVWLLHTIQAYDCIYDWLSAEERNYFEKNIFRPMTNFFITECNHEFNLIHNHGTWMTAAVGMTGFVIGDEDLVNKSLYGTENNGTGGFLAQLNLLFSPDGYYTEGAYYVRYAIWPFVVFAEAIDNNLPDLKIFEYRESILGKAFNMAMQLTCTNGEFLPFNDALKDKTWLSSEIVFAQNIIYKHYGRKKDLLSIAKAQNKVTLTGAGLLVAKDLQALDRIPPFEWKSIELHDGANGDEGGLSVFRCGSPDDQELLLFKYTSHGLSHGHFDKLSIMFYDHGEEILQDYGSARFLNVSEKYGGRYLPENSSFAKQTIAHNTVTVDERTNFGGDRSLSEKNHSEKYFGSIENADFQYASAKELNAYDGVQMHRTVVMVKDDKFSKPVILDLFRIASEEEHQYDLPFYYQGHMINTNINYKAFDIERKTLGRQNGYEHLWLEAEGNGKNVSQITWLNKERFYTVTTSSDNDTKVLFTRIGASDPNFNLRNEPCFILRKIAKNHLFASVIEPHGISDPTLEFTVGSASSFEEINVLQNDENYSAVNYKGRDINWILIISNKEANTSHKHNLILSGIDYEWQGPIVLIKN